jgi:hypothetical protein
MHDAVPGAVLLANPSRKNAGYTPALSGTVPAPDLCQEVLGAMEESLMRLLPNKDVRGLIMDRVRQNLEEVTFSSGAKTVHVPRLVYDVCNTPATVVMASLVGFVKPTVMMVRQKTKYTGLAVIGTLPWTYSEKMAMWNMATAAGWTKVWVLRVEPISTIGPVVKATCRVQTMTRE